MTAGLIVEEVVVTVQVSDTEPDVLVLSEDTAVHVLELVEVVQQGGADATYVHTQAVLAATWTVNHNLGKYPSVTVTMGGVEVETGVTYLDTNTLQVLLNSPAIGQVFCN